MIGWKDWLDFFVLFLLASIVVVSIKAFVSQWFGGEDDD
jgi:hypothetical protein